MGHTMTNRNCVASGEDIDCYHIGPWRFVARDTRNGRRYEARSMYAAIGRAMRAREKLTRGR
jgi:hypothetical protein